MMEGRQLSSYRIVSLLGTGGMGEVYRAYDEKLHREVAIKVLRSSDGDDEAGRGRLLREARAAAALNHPNICTIHEVGEHDGQAFLAMELVDGEALDHIIPAGTGLPVDRMLEYGVQVADALAHAHERGVLHRDLKTPNIVITKAGRAKVLDFGLAKRILSQVDVTTEAVSQFTGPGTLAGTPAYMSPEQLRGLPADARSDVWAMGVVLHEMAAGARPFAGKTPYELSAAILGSPVPKLPARVPPDVQSVIVRCLDKNPDGRFQSADEVRRALEDIKAGRAPAGRHLHVARRSLLGAVGAVAALLLLASTAGLVLNIAGIRDRLLNSQPLFDSIAVLPFQYVSENQDHRYLASGIQQGVINELAQLPGLKKVISAASSRRFEKSTVTPAEIARTLGAKVLVTGTVVRADDTVKIAAQLVDGTDGHQVWGGTSNARRGMSPPSKATSRLPPRRRSHYDSGRRIGSGSPREPRSIPRRTSSICAPCTSSLAFRKAAIATPGSVPPGGHRQRPWRSARLRGAGERLCHAWTQSGRTRGCLDSCSGGGRTRPHARAGSRGCSCGERGSENVLRVGLGRR